MYQALYRKWRPTTFDEVTGQAHITETLKTQVKNGRLSHAYLFTGTRGTGKTTCAKILARAVNCLHPVDGNPCNQCPSCLGIENGSILEVVELDAASNNGVENIRTLREEAVYSPAYCKTRVYIVDEVHMLSTAAFNALLKILEEPPEHLMFILATTELHKVPATILSRCQRFSFKRLSPNEIADRLTFVAKAEQILLTEEGAQYLARLSDGSLRDALSLLDQCAVQNTTIDSSHIMEILGLAGNLDTARLAKAIGSRNTPEALSILTELYTGGKEMNAILDALTGLLRDLLIVKTVPNTAAQLLTGGYQEDTLFQLVPLFSKGRLIHAIALLQETTSLFVHSSNRRTDGEVCIIRLCDERLDEDLTALSARISRLEDASSTAVHGAIETPPAFFSTSTPSSDRDFPEDMPPREEHAPLSNTVHKTKENMTPSVRRTVESVETEASESGVGPVDMSDNTSTSAIHSKEFHWPLLATSMKGKVEMPEYAVINNAQMVSGSYADGILTVTVDSSFTKSLVGKPSVSTALSQAAEVLLGQPVCVKIIQHSEADKADKLEKLMELSKQFDNIIIE